MATAMEKRPSILVARGSIDSFPVGSMRRIQSKRPSLLIGAKTLEMYGQEDEGPKFVRFIIKLFKWWGFFIAKHAWAAIVVVLIISSLGLLKIRFTPQRNDITGYTPYGARAIDEFKTFNDFFSAHGQPIAIYIFGVAKDNGSMIRQEHLEEFVKVINYASLNFTVHDDQTGTDDNFNGFCNSFCLINEPIRQFAGGMRILSDGLPSSRIKLNYPISSVFGTTFSLQPNFFGVETFSKEEDAAAHLLGDGDSNGNETDFNVLRRKISNVKSVKMIAAQLRAEQKDGWNDEKIKKYELEIVNHFMGNYSNDLIKIYVLSQTYVEEEMVRGGKIMMPYLVVGFTIMCTISCLTVMIRATYMHQQNFFKIALAITACITPLLSTATALGLMFMFGIRFASILCVIPFLVLSIGVDSSYLMIHEWQRVTKHAEEYPQKGDSVGRRMSEVLSEVGPAILISCLTNMFADLVGSFTSSPEITLLCSGNMLSMCVAFVYQMSFYAGLMCIVGEKEFSAQDDITVAANIAESKVRQSQVARGHSLVRTPSKFHDRTQPIVSSFMKRYVEIMANSCVSLVVVAFYIVFLSLSIWGITRININLSTQKLFAADSPLSELDNLRVKYIVPHYSMATVFVENPGNFSDPKRLAQMNQLVRDFERLNGSWGPDGTKYFMRDYQNFLLTMEDNDYDYTDPESEHTTVSTLNPTKYNDVDLQHFLKWPEYDFWSGLVHTKNVSADGNEQTLDKFIFTTGFHGEQLVIWKERGKMLRSWRAVADKYPEFGTSVFHEDGQYLDLIDNMANDTWQSVLGTLVCMGFVCYVFLANMFTVAIASLSVLSICCGILGIISWLGIDLDPITMASMIISIGFSVDIPAHVSYHYYQASRTSGPSSRPEDRLTQCLSSVAFPAVQAALSTILCISALLFVNLYMAQVSCKIMIICVLLCNLHGLVFIPAILICIDKLRWSCRPKGAAAQRPRVSPRHRSGKRNQASIAPEKSAVPDRPDV